MRVTKYLKSDGESWLVCKIRCSAHVSYERLNKLMLDNGWVRWHLLRDKFTELKKKIARDNPIKYPNWKEVKIPMLSAGMKDLPAQIAAENEKKTIQIEEAVNGN